MKRPLRIRYCLFLLCLVQLVSQQNSAQCPAGYTPQTIQFDTMVVGGGSGVYEFTFPQFPSALGMLISANLHSEVSLKYTYSLYHATASATYQTRMMRTDEISGSALAPTTISNFYTSPWNYINVPANTVFVHGPLGINYTQNTLINDGRLTNFLGGGSVSLTYQNSSTISVNGPTGTQIQFIDNTDTTRFSIVYTYCQDIVMAANLELLAATRKTASAAILSFKNLGLSTGNTYALEASLDGQTFKPVPASMSVSGSVYTFLYQQAPKDKFYLRVKQTSAFGKQSVSVIKSVPAAGEVKKDIAFIYPNPARDHFSYILPVGEKGNWNLKISGTAGNKVFEQQFSNTSSIDVFLNSAVPAGLYFIEAVNRETGKRYTSKINIRP